MQCPSIVYVGGSWKTCLIESVAKYRESTLDGVSIYHCEIR